MWAAYFNHLRIAELLLSAGADVNIKTIYNETALSWAKQKGHNEIIRLLINSGAVE
jgi:uncharacterized protein